MRKQNLRKVKWCAQRKWVYVLRDEIRYWAPERTRLGFGDDVHVLNPERGTITVRAGAVRETWRADATSPGQGG